jgi:hypothetical protein
VVDRELNCSVSSFTCCLRLAVADLLFLLGLSSVLCSTLTLLAPVANFDNLHFGSGHWVMEWSGALQ